MVTLAYTHDYSDAIGGVFSGDDSLVFFKENAEIPDKTQLLS